MQPTLPEVSFEQYRKPTCREQFLDEMNGVVPWADLVAVIEPVSPKAEGLMPIWKVGRWSRTIP